MKLPIIEITIMGETVDIFFNNKKSKNFKKIINGKDYKIMLHNGNKKVFKSLVCLCIGYNDVHVEKMVIQQNNIYKAIINDEGYTFKDSNIDTIEEILEIIYTECITNKLFLKTKKKKQKIFKSLFKHKNDSVLFEYLPKNVGLIQKWTYEQKEDSLDIEYTDKLGYKYEIHAKKSKT